MDFVKHIIESKNLVHKYVSYDENDKKETTIALDNINITVNEGDFVAILGRNGSGKSTFAKHINALLSPDEGTLFIDSMDATENKNRIPIRRTAGMVFQNPDNQIIAQIVEEDVGFGPENIGIETDEIWRRVDKALEAVGMTMYRKNSPNRLSGGQKQRVAIAGVMAMEPKCIVLDEPTAMLDPIGRREVIKTVHELNKEKGITIILITHHMDETIDADKIFVCDKGKIALSGTPREVFSNVEQIEGFGLEVPVATKLAYLLREKGIDIPKDIISREELVDFVVSRGGNRNDRS
ncbi:energy-coupling factor transport system ATP-binding protein [Eubacterium uniforme]|uniref:Energy-coupling factor transport system ATP-binding protein n=1 Tax=Eubacterium uniforme TaxID=39495 RepID=A0A1T4V8R6_9FIRM|nr:energy-coupling factor transporter ATPase [Eubacterium uniforme]SKA61276.1 energy-coupling factor transport system ATP-binding protein [Eubacterium uniforme]